MDTHYTYAPVYAPSQPPDHRQSFNPLSSSPSLGPNPPAFTGTLPPLSSGYPPFASDHSAQGAAHPQTAYAPTSTTAHSQHTSFPGYPRQAVFQQPTAQQTPRNFPPPQSYQSLGSSASTYRPYVPSTTHQSRLPDIRPMPLGGLHDHPPSSSASGPSSQAALSHLPTHDGPEPTHVVGSQGRRGILPSANGRPIAVPNTGSSRSSTAGLKKDAADGKWPCDHCNKRYLHAKHLKRHLLRHTGTRPYTCGLCKDNFSRSDILKRHFTKCSIRRGNPTGANHLAHSRETRKLRNGPGGPLQQLNTSSLPNQMSDSVDFSLSGFSSASELNGLDVGQSNFSEGQQPKPNQLSRTSSVKGMNQSTPASTRGNYTAPNSAGFESSGFSYSGGQATPDSLTTSGAATPFNYPNDPRSNQLSPSTTLNHPMSGLDLNSITRSLAAPNFSAGTLPHIVENSHERSNDMDWPLTHADDHEDYTSEHYHNNGNIQPHIKAEMNYHNGSFSLPQNYPPFHASSR